MGSIFQRGKVYWIKYYRNGLALRESSSSKKRGDAERLLKAREGAIATGRPILPRADKILFDELAQDYVSDYRVNSKRSLRDAERNVRHLAEMFTGRRAAHITTADVRTYIERRQRAGVSNATINRELAGLRRMFNLAIQAEKLQRKPHIPHLAEDNVRTGFFSDVDFLALHEALPEHIRPVATFAYTYGWRKAELLGLTWGQVDFTAKTVRLRPGTTKNLRGRTIAMTADIHRLLWAQWTAAQQYVRGLSPDATGPDVARRVPWVFHHDGKPIKDFRRTWATACTRAGLPGRLFHDLRRSAVRNMVRAGVPERICMAITGHRTRSIFDRYDIVSEADLHDAANTISARTETVLAEPPK